MAAIVSISMATRCAWSQSRQGVKKLASVVSHDIGINHKTRRLRAVSRRTPEVYPASKSGWHHGCLIIGEADDSNPRYCWSGWRSGPAQQRLIQDLPVRTRWSLARLISPPVVRMRRRSPPSPPSWRMTTPRGRQRARVLPAGPSYGRKPGGGEHSWHDGRQIPPRNALGHLRWLGNIASCPHLHRPSASPGSGGRRNNTASQPLQPLLELRQPTGV